MEILFAVTNSIALIDMVMSFALVVRYNNSMYTRPVLTDSSSNAAELLVIQAGRHPIICETNNSSGGSKVRSLNKLGDNGSFVSNDCFIGTVLVLRYPSKSVKINAM